MKKLMFLVSTLFFLGSFPLIAGAFDIGACHEDIEKYCKDVPLANDQLKKCMVKHIHEFSDACKANMVDVAVKKKQEEAKK